MDKKEETYRWLDENGITYKKVDHNPVYTVEEMVAERVCDHGNVCKNLFLRDDKGKRHFLVVAHKDRQIDLKEIGVTLGSRLSFASEERLAKYLNLTKGSVTPLGVMYDREAAVQVVLDKGLQEEHMLGVHPCDNTATVFISYGDLKRLIEKNGNTILFI